MILDALSRAEKERQAEETSHLDTTRYVPTSTIKEDRFKKWVLIALAANFALIMLFAGAYFWNNYISNHAEEVAAISQPQSEVDTTVHNKADVVMQDANTPVVDQADPIPEPISQQPKQVTNNLTENIDKTDSLSSLESEAHVKANQPVVTPKIKKTVAKKTIKKVPPVQYSSTPLNQASSNNKPTVASITEAVSREKQAATASSYTLLSDMPVSQRAELSQYEVNVHVYDDSPLSRFVLINMVKYKEGDGISGSTARIAAIVPEGVVLNYANRQVLLERNK